MRFIGKIATLPIRRHIEEWDDRAQEKRVVQQGIMAIFEQGSLSDHEVAVGLEKLGPFTGLPILEDDQVPVSPRKLIRVYDTDIWAISEGWDKSTKKFVEDYLVNHALHGREFVAVETPRAPAPWPSYDKLVVAKGKVTLAAVVEKIVATVTEYEYDPIVVLAYERENANRPQVVAALEQLVPVKEIDLAAIAAAAAGASSADDLITA